MRSFVKDKMKSGVEKVKKPFREIRDSRAERRASKLVDGPVEEDPSFEETEAYRRKKEKAARMREEAKLRHTEEQKKRQSEATHQSVQIPSGGLKKVLSTPGQGQQPRSQIASDKNALTDDNQLYARQRTTHRVARRSHHPGAFEPQSLLQHDILEAMQQQESEESDPDALSSEASTQPKTFQPRAFSHMKEDPYSQSGDANGRAQSSTSFSTDFKLNQHAEAPRVSPSGQLQLPNKETQADKQGAQKTEKDRALSESIEPQQFKLKSELHEPASGPQKQQLGGTAAKTRPGVLAAGAKPRNQTERESRQPIQHASQEQFEEVDFNLRRQSKKGASNDKALEKLRNGLARAQNNAAAHDAHTQQDSPLDFDKKNQRKQFSAYADISDMTRTDSETDGSHIKNDSGRGVIEPFHQIQYRNDAGRGAIAVRKHNVEDPTAMEHVQEVKQSQTSSEESYDSEEDFRMSDVSKLEGESGEKQIDQIDDEQQELDDRQNVDDFVETLMGWNEEASEKADMGDDMIVLVNQSELLFITYAKDKLAQNKQLIQARAREEEAKKGQEKSVQQNVLNGPRDSVYGQCEPHLQKTREKQKPTCITISDEVIVYGTDSGAVWAYNRETSKLYGRYENSDRDAFEGNAVCCIAFHYLRTEYVVVGFQGGQIILLDLTENENGKLKSKKTIKDHHKGSALVSVRFCDWLKERESSVVPQALQETPEQQANRQSASLVEDKQAWMIASIDVDGKVVISTITNVAFGLLSASKFVIVDPQKDALKLPDSTLPKYESMECRFFDKIFPQGFYNDSQTWLTLGSKDEVQILNVTRDSCDSRFGLKRPKFYPSARTKGYAPFPEAAPVIAWGYGRTPVFKHRTYALMAVAWGPLIQLLLLVPDDEKAMEGSDFRIDGQYIISPGSVQDTAPGTSTVQDVRVESMFFLSESILLVYTSTQDIRVLYTQGFHNGQYVSPTLDEAMETPPEFDKIDSRLQLLDVGSPYTMQQLATELERRKFLQDPIQSSLSGPPAGQTLSAFQDWVVFLTEKGIRLANHLTWQESLQSETEDMQTTWIETFQKMVDIFQGRIKGFKGTPDNVEIRQEGMKADLKLMISALIEKVITQWKARAAKVEQRQTSSATVQERLIENHRTLIKRTIELCIDINEPLYLFTELFQKFVDQDMSELFSEELIPYILGGVFSEIDVPEEILDNYILKYPYEAYLAAKQAPNGGGGADPFSTERSPAEGFEKILVNTNFSLCSDRYIQRMIQFCRENRMSTGLFYLCISTQGELGTAAALFDLRYLYEQIKRDELNNADKEKIHTADDLNELSAMPANLPARVAIEQSSCYVGYKLLWAIRMLLLGKRFPKGHFDQNTWHDLTHEVLDIITNPDFVKTLCEIDAQAYFQIVTIAWNKPSMQHDFLAKGRPVSRTSGPGIVRIVMTHEEIFNRVSKFCEKYDEGTEIRTQFLFFVASIANELHEIEQSAAFFYEVTKELLRHNQDFLAFNKNLLNRQMTNKQLFRKLSRKGFDAPDKVKHIILSEENVMILLQRCEDLEPSKVEVLIDQIKDSNFDSLKLVLYEKQENYMQCLKLLLEADSSSSFITLKMQDRFAWIMQKFVMLESRIKDRDENTQHKYQFEMFQREILCNAATLVGFDAHKTVGLADALFEGDHLKFLNHMDDSPEQKFAYVSKLLELHGEECKQAILDYAIQNTADPRKAQVWQKILRLHLQLACKLEPDSVIQIVRNAANNSHYPLEEYLKICQEQNQTEACAILCKKIGAYKDAVNYYMMLLGLKLNMRGLLKELWELNKTVYLQDMRAKREMHDREIQAIEREQQRMREQQNLDVNEFSQRNTNIEQLIRRQSVQFIQTEHFEVISIEERLKHALLTKQYNEKKSLNIDLIEKVLKTVTKLISRQPDEVMSSSNQVWTGIVQCLLQLYYKPELRRKRYARQYVALKFAQVVRVMLKYISLEELLEGTLRVEKKLRFKAIKQLTGEVFWDKRNELDLMVSAKRITEEENKNLENIMFHSRGTGLPFRQYICNLCKRDVIKTSLESQKTSAMSGYDPRKDNVIIFDCPGHQFNHVFHEGCLKAEVKRELERDKKASTKEKDIVKAMRCLECYQQKQDISGALEHTQRRVNRAGKGGHKRGLSRVSNASGPSADSQSVGESGEPEGVDFSQAQRDMRQQKYDRIGKSMNRFDDDLTFDTLQLHDFRKHC